MSCMEDPVETSKINNLKVVIAIYHYSGYNERVVLIKIVFNLLKNTKHFINKSTYVDWFYKELKIITKCCSVIGCTNKRGIFPECKIHFNKVKYFTKGKIVWFPFIKGYETIKNIAKDYPEVIRLNNVLETPLNCDRIIVNCNLCDYKWSIDAKDIWGTYCSSCSGACWSVQRLQYETLKRLDLIFDLSIKDTKIHCSTKILVSCGNTGCKYTQEVTLKRIFSNDNRFRYQCQRCAGTELWSLEKIHIEAVNKPNIDFSLVTQEHIDVKKGYSNIPIRCKLCNYGFDGEWIRSINHVFREDYDDCPGCNNCKKMDF